MKTKIDKLLKKDIDNLVREVTIDLINYLYEYGFDLDILIDKINSTEFIFFDDNLFKKNIFYRVGKKIKKKELNLIGYEGAFIPIIDLNENQELVIYKKICAINLDGPIRKDNPHFKQKIIHELLHLLSAKDSLEKIEKYSYYYTGFSKTAFLKNKNNSYRNSDAGDDEFNEAVTDLLADNIYRDIYDDDFILTCTMEGKIRRPCINSYYFNKMLIKVLNLLAYGTNDTTHLLLSYMTNDLNIYLEQVESNLRLSYIDLKNVMYISQYEMEVYLKTKSQNSMNYMKENFMRIFMLSLSSLERVYDHMNISKEEKEEWENYLKNNIKFLCYFPVYKNMQQDIENVVEAIL